MKVSIFLLLFFIANMVFAQDDYQSNIEKHRTDKDEQLQSRKTSPLQRKDRKSFHDLPYFEVDEMWKIDADLRLIESGKVIEIPTSAGYSKKFKEYGVLEISIGENYFPLTAYVRVPRDGEKPSDHPSLFVPFKDLTTGEATYGGGRYLDIALPPDGKPATVDFNLAYSPYCAYGDGFACPIPPEQNFIKAEVTAGEKAYLNH